MGRRDFAESDSARGLLITVLGEFVLPSGGSAWTQTLIDAMELVDVGAKATRQALARLAERDWLDRTRDGRRTRWHLTETSHRVLDAGATRIYGLGRDTPDWDGRWLVLLASLSPADEHLRYRLTTDLGWSGFGSLGQGTWLSPWTEHEAAAVGIVERLGIDSATTFVAEIGRLGSGSELAARAWELDTLRRRYDDFLAAAAGPTGSVEGALVDGDDAVRRLVDVVHRWRRFPALDPELPYELLPTDWPGRAAADRFAALRRELAPAARAWWSGTDAGYGPAAHTASSASLVAG